LKSDRIKCFQRKTKKIIIYYGLNIVSIIGCDIVIVVIDVNKYLKDLEKDGVDTFVRDHIKSILDNQLNKSVGSDELFKKKEIVVAFNKKDLLSNENLNKLNDVLKSYGETISISRIECGDIRKDISELLNNMKNSLSKL